MGGLGGLPTSCWKKIKFGALKWGYLSHHSAIETAKQLNRILVPFLNFDHWLLFHSGYPFSCCKPFSFPLVTNLLLLAAMYCCCWQLLLLLLLLLLCCCCIMTQWLHLYFSSCFITAAILLLLSLLSGLLLVFLLKPSAFTINVA